jgi:dUTP pyrophosphatase
MTDNKEPKYKNKSQHERYLLINKLDPMAIIPSRGSKYAAGYDIYPFTEGIVPARSRAIISTKIAFGFANGYYCKLSSRSGNSAKSGIEVGAGVIDSDYRGEIMVILYNHSDVDFKYSRDKAIAQAIFMKHETLDIKDVKNINDLIGSTDRDTSGFGSTDVYSPS